MARGIPKRKPARGGRVHKKAMGRASTVGHAELNLEARLLGTEAIAWLPVLKPKSPLAARNRIAGQKENVLQRLIKGAAGSPIPKGRFDRSWRDAVQRHDELIPTSFMREFLAGVLAGGKKLNSDQLKELDTVVDKISEVRIPTRLSGFALKSAVMQHPTKRGTAVFADPYKTAGAHARLDVARKRYVTEAMKAERAKKGSFDDVVQAGVRASIEFTLNYFTAPVTASNVFAHSSLKGQALSADDKRELLAPRENMKALYRKLGGVLRDAPAGESAAGRVTRAWEGEAHLRELDQALQSSKTKLFPTLKRSPSAPRLALK